MGKILRFHRSNKHGFSPLGFVIALGILGICAIGAFIYLSIKTYNVVGDDKLATIAAFGVSGLIILSFLISKQIHSLAKRRAQTPEGALHDLAESVPLGRPLNQEEALAATLILWGARTITVIIAWIFSGLFLVSVIFFGNGFFDQSDSNVYTVKIIRTYTTSAKSGRYYHLEFENIPEIKHTSIMVSRAIYDDINARPAKIRLIVRDGALGMKWLQSWEII